MAATETLTRPLSLTPTHSIQSPTQLNHSHPQTETLSFIILQVAMVIFRDIYIWILTTFLMNDLGDLETHEHTYRVSVM
jgi:hypothetical protein